MQRSFDELGEAEFRRRLTSGEFGPNHTSEYKTGEALLEKLDREREVGHRTKATSQTEELVEEAREANRLAKEANRVSKEANRVAMAAFILAAIALALSLGLFID